MSTLGYLERTLGSMHSWHQDILRYLFLVAPTHYTLLELAAFFYGNGISLRLATECLTECLSPSQDDVAFFLSKYALWDRCTDVPFLYEYYDMSVGLVVQLRGAEYRDERVVVEESCFPIKIGFGVSVFSFRARCVIAEMRAASH